MTFFFLITSMATIHQFKVEMTCEGCSNAVKRVLGKLEDKVKNVDINMEQQLVSVESALTSEELLEIIKKTGKATSYVGIKS